MAARLQPARRHVHLYSDGFTRWRGGNPQCFRMTYAWSGFHIVRLGENHPAQSVGKPDLQNASARYNEADIFTFCYATREKRLSREEMLVAYGVSLL